MDESIHSRCKDGPATVITDNADYVTGLTPGKTGYG
jgi:hypothetical protein